MVKVLSHLHTSLKSSEPKFPKKIVFFYEISTENGLQNFMRDEFTPKSFFILRAIHQQRILSQWLPLKPFHFFRNRSPVCKKCLKLPPTQSAVTSSDMTLYFIRTSHSKDLDSHYNVWKLFGYSMSQLEYTGISVSLFVDKNSLIKAKN